MEAVHIRQMFKVQLPSSWSKDFIPTTTDQPNNFGFSITNFYSTHAYRLELFCLGDNERQARTLTTWASWAKKNAIIYNNDGPILQIKINHGVTDFRKQAEQYARIIVKHYVDGAFTKQGASVIFKILPKKRNGNLEREAIIPVGWEAENEVNHPLANQNDLSLVDLSSDSPSEPQATGDEWNSNVIAESHTSSYGILPYSSESLMVPGDEAYMVLYNGNAEVIGNFRALNFYKASDINIKEDISLLAEERDCRELLLQIDGVGYRFKKSVHPNTNRRFVGYIAQQIESVVPEAVQLIDGILHVDYESLIPFLSESIKRNFRDIQDIKSNTDHLKLVIDAMYEQFVQSEQKAKKYEDDINQYQSSGATNKRKVWWITSLVFIAAIIVSVSIGVYVYSHRSVSDNSPPTPLGTVNPTNTSELRMILEEFFHATYGHDWTRKDNWLTSAELKYWYGLTFDGPILGRLVLPNNNLQGTIPDSFNQLKNLRRIDLSNNKLYGSVGPLLENDKLRELNISRNSFSGTFPNMELANLGVWVLDVSHNRFYGHIANFAFFATYHADLSYNALTGELPDMSSYPSLLHFDISHNYLSGTVNSRFWWIKLEVLLLDNNAFISEASLLAGLSNLRRLSIANNIFRGTLKLEKNELQQLEFLNVSYTQIDAIDVGMSEMNDNTICDASGVKFACPLPSWMIEKCHAQCVNKTA